MAAPKEKSAPVKKSKSKIMLLRCLNITRTCIFMLSILGFCTSMMALYIEAIKSKNSSYVAICDLSDYVSCSKVLTSKWSKGFGLVQFIFSEDSILNQPNSVYGLAFYAFHASLGLSDEVHAAVAQTVTSLLANICSVYLAYILIFVLEDLCVLCLSVYVVNFFLLMASLYKLKYTTMKQMKQLAKKKE